MNNKSFTTRKFAAIAAMLLSSFAFSAQAQTWEISPKFEGADDAPVAIKAPVAKIDPAANQKWWGYFTTDMKRIAVGTQKAGTFNQAFHIKPGNEVAIGNKIKAIRFYLRDKSVIKDLKIWISKTLPGDVTKAEYYKALDLSTLASGDETNGYAGKVNDILLDNAYNVGTEGAYVGLIFTVPSASSETAKYPIVLGSTPDVKEALLLGAPGQQWEDLYGQGLGVLAAQVLVEGTFHQNAIVPLDFSTAYAGLGKTTTFELNVTNCGTEGISNFDYTVTTDGVASAEKHVNLATPFKVFGGVTTVEVTLDADAQSGTKEKTITITKVNGVPNQANSSSCKGNLTTVDKLFKRVIVMEEFTGTGCPWCPRGIVGMKNANEAYPDNFAGIALHNYNSDDPMSMSAYARLGFDGAPQCQLNRDVKCDPYYGSDKKTILNDIKRLLIAPPAVGVEVKGELTNNNTEVKVKVNLDPLTSGKYSLAYVLVADSLYNSKWKQGNNYAQFSPAQAPEDMKDFCKGGKYGKSYCSPVFDDVAVSSSYNTAGINQATSFNMQKDVAVTQEYTLKMPTKKSVKEVLKLNKLNVVVILLDSKGKVVNAGKATVTLDPTGIEEVNNNAAEVKEVARYTVDGRRINAPQRGVNIVKYSDGRSVKEIVR